MATRTRKSDNAVSTVDFGLAVLTGDEVPDSLRGRKPKYIELVKQADSLLASADEGSAIQVPESVWGDISPEGFVQSLKQTAEREGIEIRPSTLTQYDEDGQERVMVLIKRGTPRSFRRSKSDGNGTPSK